MPLFDMTRFESPNLNHLLKTKRKNLKNIVNFTHLTSEATREATLSFKVKDENEEIE